MAVLVREFSELRESLKARLLAGGQGMEREIQAPRIQKPALALAGYLDQLHPGRVQLLGNAEIGYLRRLEKQAAEEAVEALCAADISCIVVCNKNLVPEALRRGCSRHNIPLFLSERRTATAIRTIHAWLEERFAPQTTVHGVLLRVTGLGILLTGKSGIGKSEAGLALLNRGHRLVADDVVLLREAPPGVLKGHAPEGLRHHIEIRGLGVLNVAELFGTLATREETPVDLAIEFTDSAGASESDRLGIEDRTISFLGVEIPYLQIQLRPGRDIATLVEVAARNQHLKSRGIHGARRFVAAMDRNLRRAAGRKGE